MLRRLLMSFAPAEANPFEAFRAQALVLYLLLVLAVAVSWGIEHALAGVLLPAAVYGVVIAINVALLVSQRLNQKTLRHARTAVVTALLAITAATYLTGGLRLTNVVPFIGLMVAAVFMLGREGVLWAVGVALLALAFQLGHWVGLPYPDLVPPADRPLDAFVTWITSVLLILLWLWAYERARMQTIEEVARGERRVRALFDGTPDLALLHDERGRLLETNAALVERLGYTGEELAQMSIGDIWRKHAPERLAERLAELRRHGQVVFEGELLTRDGRFVSVETHARLLAIEGRPAVLSVLRDIGGRLANERERTQMAAQLQQAQKMESVGRLAGGVAHDFNNLLTAITGYCELIGAAEELGDQTRRDLAEVRRAAGRAASLTKQLLAFGRRQLNTPRVIELADAVEQSLRMLRRLIGEDIALSFERGDGPSWVLVDPHQLDQLLINLAVNARDAMPSGGQLRLSLERCHGEVDGGLSPQTEGAGGSPQIEGEPSNGLPSRSYAALEISDTGCGMDEATRQRIFEPFFTTKEVGKGSGLGLATVYGIVKQNRGSIRVRSVKGQGTTFRICLPLRDQPQRAAESGPQQTIPRGSERIVLVEDETRVRELAQRVLAACGYSVDACESAEAAKLFFDGLGPDDASVGLLLTDVVMPGDSGLELAKTLRKTHPQLRVLFTSGYPEEIVSQRGVPAAEMDLLLKPYTPQILAQRVRASLDR
jgi:two-component system cell cycle sensor histidine kinase/response regulator CckA